MTPALMAWSLLRAALEGGFAVVLVALVVRLVPRLPASTRAALWWLASARLLLALVPALPLALPAGSVASRAAWVAAPVRTAGERLASAFTQPEAPGKAAAVARPGTAAHLPWTPIAIAALTLWVIGAIVMLVRLTREQRRLDAVWRDAAPFDAARLSSWAWSWLSAPGWAAVPAVRVSERVEVPLTLGWFKPRILLPATSLALPEDELRLALAHEFVHVRRHDLLLGWVPALAHAMFWFLPLAGWCGREYSQAREQACDAAALTLTGAAPREYGELLLRFGVATSIPSTAVALCGSRTRRDLTRRLLMLERFARPSLAVRVAGALLLFVGTIALLPVRLVSREAQAHESPTSDEGTPKERFVMPADVDADAFGYLFMRQGEKGTRGAMRAKDFELAKRVQNKYDADLWMVRLEERTWVITDAEVQQKARAILAPQDAMEASRRPLDRQMNALEAEMQRAEDRMQSNEDHVADLESQIAELKARRDRVEDDADEARDLTARIAALNQQRQQVAAEREQIAEEREEIYSRREALYRQSMALYDQGERLRPGVTRRLKQLAQESIDKGLAEPVK